MREIFAIGSNEGFPGEGSTRGESYSVVKMHTTGLCNLNQRMSKNRFLTAKTHKTSKHTANTHNKTKHRNALQDAWTMDTDLPLLPSFNGSGQTSLYVHYCHQLNCSVEQSDTEPGWDTLVVTMICLFVTHNIVGVSGVGKYQIILTL